MHSILRSLAADGAAPNQLGGTCRLRLAVNMGVSLQLGTVPETANSCQNATGRSPGTEHCARLPSWRALFWLAGDRAPFFSCRAVQALRKAAKLARTGPTAVHAYRLLAQMAQVSSWRLLRLAAAPNCIVLRFQPELAAVPKRFHWHGWNGCPLPPGLGGHLGALRLVQPPRPLTQLCNIWLPACLIEGPGRPPGGGAGAEPRHQRHRQGGAAHRDALPAGRVACCLAGCG